MRPTERRPVAETMRRPGVLALTIFALVWVVFAPNYWIFTLTAAVPVTVAGLGLLVLQGWAREISLASAALFATALYAFGYLNRPDNFGQNIPWLVAGLVAIGLVAALMTAVAALSIRLPGIYLIVLTFGLQMSLEKVVFPIAKLSGGLSSGSDSGEPISNPRPWFFGLPMHSDTTFYYFSLAWLAAVLVVMVRLRRSPAGLALHLVGADRQAAAGVGIFPLRYRLAAFAISGVLAGLGGILASWLYITPPVYTNYLFPYSLLLLAIPVLAGRDNIAWVVVVATAFQVVPLALQGSRVNTFFLAGVGLILGCAAGSRGIGGRVQDLVAHFRGTDRPTPSSTVAARPSRAQALKTLRAWLPSTTGDQTALAARDVCVQIGGVSVLDRVSLTVPNGELVGLVGPNGAGKSTLFDVISGVRPPESGRVEMIGADVTATPAWRRARLGVVRTFQDTRVVDHLTVADNLLIGAVSRIESREVDFLAGVPRAWEELGYAEEVARAVARLLGVEKHWHRRADQIEFSARRRIELGRALLAAPRVLLLDEPTAGLDPDSSARLFALIRDLHRDLGLTVLLVEHHIPEVLSTCTLVHVLATGTLLASGTPEEILANTSVRDTYLGYRVHYSTNS